MLREAEVALAQGQSIGQACRTLGVSELEKGCSAFTGVIWFSQEPNAAKLVTIIVEI